MRYFVLIGILSARCCVQIGAVGNAEADTAPRPRPRPRPRGLLGLEVSTELTDQHRSNADGDSTIVIAANRFDPSTTTGAGPAVTLYNDVDIILTHVTSLVSTNTVTTVPCRVLHITLSDTSC